MKGFCKRRSNITISYKEKEKIANLRRHYMTYCSSIEYEILKSLDDLYKYYDFLNQNEDGKYTTYADIINSSPPSSSMDNANDDQDYAWLSQLEPVAEKDGFFIHEIKPI